MPASKLKLQFQKYFKLSKSTYIILITTLTGFLKHFEDVLTDSKSTSKVLRSTKVTDHL